MSDTTLTADEVQTLLADIPEANHLRATVALLCWSKHDPAIVVHLLPGLADYPNDIASVFRDLVPAMRERGWRLLLSGDRKPDGWAVEFEHEENRKSDEPRSQDYSSWFAGAEDPNPARAICLAAARAAIPPLQVAPSSTDETP